MKLPLIDYASSFFEEGELSDCYVIGVQHLLVTTHSMFKVLAQRGLKAENVAILGKCYSTDPEVFHAMRSEGFDICDNSLEYNSHEPFDLQFKRQVHYFLSQRRDKINSSIGFIPLSPDTQNLLVNRFKEVYTLQEKLEV